MSELPESNKIPTAQEIFEKAREVGYDSLGICSDPELQVTLDALIEGQLSEKIEALLKYREVLWKKLGLVK